MVVGTVRDSSSTSSSLAVARGRGRFFVVTRGPRMRRHHEMRGEPDTMTALLHDPWRDRSASREALAARPQPGMMLGTAIEVNLGSKMGKIMRRAWHLGLSGRWGAL